MEHFFKPGRIYAVVGASAAKEKFGHKVFKWYVDRHLPVTAVNPKGDVILDHQAVKHISEVNTPGENEDLALSVITPPAVTKQLFEDLKKLDNSQKKIQAVWLQPGTHNAEVTELAKSVVPIVIEDCILVNGDKYLKSRL